MRVILLCLMLFCTAAIGAPFIVSDPWPTTVSQPTNCHLLLDASPDKSIPVTKNADGSVYCNIDIAGASIGPHISSVNVCNDAGCSASVPLNFTLLPALSKPTAPTNLRIKL